jgi:predicted nuclease with TOPRIM domain
MWYGILILAIVVLFIALLAEIKSSNKKTDETNNLLSDYQKRVDEQQKLLDDYRALEKNFDNVGEGYEQALLAFDKMEEEKQKMLETSSQLEQEVQKMKGAYQAVQQNYEIVDQLVKQAETEAGKLETDAKLIGIIRKLQDLSELGSQAPINVGKRGVPRQIADEAVAQSGILNAKYVRFGIMVAEDAADAEF